MTSKRTLACTGFMSMVLWSFTAGNTFADSVQGPTNTKQARATLLGLPLGFESNEGQTDKQVKFLSHGDGYSLFLTSNEAVFTLRRPAGINTPPAVFRMELAGASRNARVSGAEKLPGAVNYFVGNDPKKWHSGITGYSKVDYHGIYPGVDAVFYGNQRQLEYDFVVAPGADPGQISLALTGVTPGLDGEGNVSLGLPDGDLTLKKPAVYQDFEDGRKIVEARYAIAGNRVRFQLGKYDHSRRLVIDPVFTYLTYLGGSNADEIGSYQVDGQTLSPAQAIAVDSAGDVYVTGYTMSTNFPVASAYQAAPVKGSSWTAFVSALNPSGTALLYSTFLGGSAYTGGASVAWDSHDSSLYVAGTTNSSDFPITAGAFQTILAPFNYGGKPASSGQYNAFVAKFNAAGQLTNSTFLGGTPQTDGFGVAADSQGRAYVVGTTVYNCIPPAASYSCFPTTAGAVIPAGTISQNGDGFVSVFDPTLSTLLYSTLLGDPNGSQTSISEAFGVTVDTNANFYVVGVTGSSALPATSGAYQPKPAVTSAPLLVGFAAKFGPVTAGASLTYLTYLEATGTSYGDFPGGVAADSQGNAYIGGYTNSLTFPVTAGAYNTPCPLNGARLCPAAFVTKLNPAGTGVVWSSFVEPADFFSAIQLDAQGNVYLTGHSSGAFQGVNALQPGLISGAFVSELDPTGSTLLFSSVVGASAQAGNTGNSTPAGLAVDSQGNVYLAGNINDATLPTTPGVVQPVFAGGSGAYGDGLIAKINLGPTVTPGGVVPVYSSSTTIESGEWASIYGSGLASGTTLWTGNYPTSLGGTSVTIDGNLAYLSLVSPSQINFQVPLDTKTGSVPVVIRTANGTVTATVTLGQIAPSLLVLDTKHVAGIILRFNGTGAYGGGTYDILGPTGSSLGYPTVAAKTGDTVALYGTGFGPTTPSVPPGQAFSGAASTTNTVTLSIGGVSVMPSFAGLSGAGLDQINLTVPTGLGAGDLALVASVGGVSTQPTIVISVQ